MNNDCSGVEDVADDLAFGLLTGIDRATALAHLDECHSCRTDVASLTDVAEAMLLLAPAAVPDAGFDRRVLDRIERDGDDRGDDAAPPAVVSPPPRRHRLRSIVAVAAVVAAVAALVGVSLAWTGARSSPTEVAADMTDGGGDVVGQVSLVAEQATVVMVDLPGWETLVRRYGESAGSQYSLELTLDDGSRERVALPDHGAGSWEVKTGVDRSDVATVAIVDGDGLTWCRARFL